GLSKHNDGNAESFGGNASGRNAVEVASPASRLEVDRPPACTGVFRCIPLVSLFVSTDAGPATRDACWTVGYLLVCERTSANDNRGFYRLRLHVHEAAPDGTSGIRLESSIARTKNHALYANTLLRPNDTECLHSRRSSITIAHGRCNRQAR